MSMFQASGTTGEDRYPSVFSYCADYARARGWQAPRLLSVGCSRGDELITLRRYFPDADIWGIDISERAVCASQRTVADHKGRVLRADVMDIAEVAGAARFQMIFGMTVFLRSQHAGTFNPFDIFIAGTSGLPDIRRVFPFEEFDAAMRRLDGVLVNDGLLVLVNSSYRFHDTSLAPRYEPATDRRVRLSGHWWKYDRGGTRLDYRPLPRLLSRVGRAVLVRSVLIALKAMRLDRRNRWLTYWLPRQSFYRYCVFRKLRAA
jgi:hypothetical protein